MSGLISRASLPQAGDQRRRRRVAPDQNQRPAIAIDAVFRKRRLTAEIEQALVKPPLRILRRHMGHGAYLCRNPEIQPLPRKDNKTCHRDRGHAGAEAEHLSPARDAEAEWYLDKPVSRPSQHDAGSQDQLAFEQRQRTELMIAKNTSSGQCQR